MSNDSESMSGERPRDESTTQSIKRGLIRVALKNAEATDPHSLPSEDIEGEREHSEKPDKDI